MFLCLTVLSLFMLAQGRAAPPAAMDIGVGGVQGYAGLPVLPGPGILMRGWMNGQSKGNLLPPQPTIRTALNAPRPVQQGIGIFRSPFVEGSNPVAGLGREDLSSSSGGGRPVGYGLGWSGLGVDKRQLSLIPTNTYFLDSDYTGGFQYLPGTSGSSSSSIGAGSGSGNGLTSNWNNNIYKWQALPYYYSAPPSAPLTYSYYTPYTFGNYNPFHQLQLQQQSQQPQSQ